MITAADFRARNNIVFEAPLLQDSQVQLNVKHGWTVPNADFTNLIDLNGNGKVDFTNTQQFPNGDRSAVDTYLTATEPSLNTTYAAIKELAGQKGTEVLTQDDVQDPGVTFQQTKYHLTNYGGSNVTQYIASKTESLEQLKEDLAANLKGAVGAKWAFDCNANTFVLYTPKNA